MLTIADSYHQTKETFSEQTSTNTELNISSNSDTLEELISNNRSHFFQNSCKKMVIL